MSYPEDLKYSKEHEWIRVKDNVGVIGITHYAQDHLGEVVFVELPKEGDQFSAGETLGVVESVKSVSDVFIPVGGQVLEINESVVETPEIINEDPYGEGWLIKIKIKGPDELKALMGSQEYQAFLKEEGE